MLKRIPYALVVMLLMWVPQVGAAERTDQELVLPAELMKKWGLTEVPEGHYARDLMDRVCKAAKYQGPRIRVYVGDVPNAAAYQYNFKELSVLTPEGPRHPYIMMVMYNPTFMTRYAFTAGNEYVALGIFAHEMGHLIHRHTDSTNPLAAVQHPWEHEIEADEFAGAVLARLGASPDDIARTYRLMCVQHWMAPVNVNGKAAMAFGDESVRLASLTKGSATHPDIVRRIQAVSRGYLRGGGTGDVETNLHGIFRDLANEVVRWELNDSVPRRE